MIIKKGSVSMDSERLKIYNRNVIKVKEDINKFIKDIIEDNNNFRPSYALKYKTPIEYRIQSGFP